MRRLLTLPALGLSLVALALATTTSCARPTIDGGWEGTARCDSDAFPLTGVFDESEDGDVDGTVYIEGFAFGLIAKGVVERGTRDAEDGHYEFDLETDDDEPADFAVEMSFEDDSTDELEGTVDVLDGNGDVESSCALSLDRVGDDG